jgi:site-specific DNA-methyltransferase (adenine-specific)
MKLEEMKNKIVCMDCMELMALMPDKYIDLAIVDPPYGIGGGVKR